jgi:hypothetical protein
VYCMHCESIKNQTTSRQGVTHDCAARDQWHGATQAVLQLGVGGKRGE